jgi:hypothetical protein
MYMMYSVNSGHVRQKSVVGCLARLVVEVKCNISLILRQSTRERPDWVYHSGIAVILSQIGIVAIPIVWRLD